MTTAVAPKAQIASAVLRDEPGGDALQVADAAVGVTDAGVGRAMVFGLTVGTAVMFLVAVGIGLAAGLGLGTAAAVAVVPGLFGGLFGGGSPALLVQLERFEKQEGRSHA
jgi:hypothetical protein